MALPAVAICADDYALTPGISAAILDLAAAGRLSAVSCMTAARHWRSLGPALRPFADRLDIGLHLTLVDEAPLTPMPRLAPGGRLPSIGQLIVKSHLGLVPREEIEREILSQVESFVAVMGRPPAHIDGHLHAHVLPGIRETVLSVAEQLAPRPWLRSITDPAVFSRPSALKAAFLDRLGRKFARCAVARGFKINEGFSGFYDFGSGDYASVFPRFLAGVGARHLILCHPGRAPDAAAWAEARAGEHAFLKNQSLLPPSHIVRISQL